MKNLTNTLKTISLEKNSYAYFIAIASLNCCIALLFTICGSLYAKDKPVVKTKNNIKLECSTDTECENIQDEFRADFYEKCFAQIKCAYNADCATKDEICMEIADNVYYEHTLTLKHAKEMIKSKVATLENKNPDKCHDINYHSCVAMLYVDQENFEKREYECEKITAKYCDGIYNNKQLHELQEKNATY